MFETLFGSAVPPALKFFLAFVIVLGLIGVTAWLVRRFGADRFGGAAARGRQPRLAVVDAATVDGRRRLVIIRRDNVEHLLMIGGPTDVLVEANIVRAVGAAREKAAEPAGARPMPGAEAANRSAAVAVEGSLWPLQPQPETAPRPTRTTLTEETTLQWTTWQAEAEQTPAPARPETPAGLSDELPGRAAPKHDFAATPPKKPATPAPSRAAPSSAETAGTADKNLTEMAHRLEAALRRPNEPLLPPEPGAKQEPSLGTRPSTTAQPRMEPKPPEEKSPSDSLEQEMASLLGRLQGKP